MIEWLHFPIRSYVHSAMPLEPTTFYDIMAFQLNNVYPICFAYSGVCRGERVLRENLQKGGSWFASNRRWEGERNSGSEAVTQSSTKCKKEL